MLQIDESKWDIYDPDKILGYQLKGFDRGVLGFGAAIHPREDMMQFTHKESRCIVDFGYYGCEVELDGFYVVRVVDGNLEEGWHQPLERLESKDFLEGIVHAQAMLEKYT